MSDIVYYNSAYTNPYDPTIDPASKIYIPAQTIEIRNEPIINNPSEYYASVIRFDVDAESIQIFDFAQTNQGAPDPTYYVVALQTSTESRQAGVVYVPSIASQIPFVTPIYSYKDFLDMINTALLTAFNAIITKPSGITAAPYLTYDPISKLISLVAQAGYATVAFGTQPIKIWMNTPLYQFFYNFKAFYTPNTGLQNTSLFNSITNPNGQPLNYNILVEYNGTNLYANMLVDVNNPPTLLASAVKITQEYQNLYKWDELRKIVVLSNNIPIATEYINAAFENDVLNSGTTNNVLRILTDYLPQNDQFIGASRSVLTYVPTAQYRLADMQGNVPLKTLDFSFYWEDRFQKLRPVILGPSNGFNIKLMFIKKDFYLKLSSEEKQKFSRFNY